MMDVLPSPNELKSKITELGLESFPKGIQTNKKPSKESAKKERPSTASKQKQQNPSGKSYEAKGKFLDLDYEKQKDEFKKELEEMNILIPKGDMNEKLAPLKKNETMQKPKLDNLGKTAFRKGHLEHKESKVEFKKKPQNREKNMAKEKVDTPIVIQNKINPDILSKEITEKSSLLLSSTELWFNIASAVEERGEDFKSIKNEESVKFLKNIGKKLLEMDRKIYEMKTNKRNEKNPDYIWMNTVLKSGTLNDKLAALTLMLQESPIHKFHLVESLMNMAKKKSRRENLMAIDSLKNLFLQSLLPNSRKLKWFHQQPLEDPQLDHKTLALWIFEDSVKTTFGEFIGILESSAMDMISNMKTKAMGHLYDILSQIPENEARILRSLIHKIGDPDSKIATKAIHYLQQLLIKHPNMKNIVALEVQRFMDGNQITDKSLYYSICFLNQMILTNNDKTLANTLIDVYFGFFKSCVTLKKKNINPKMLSGLLVGVNRAFPFSDLKDDIYLDHLNTLFSMVHHDSLTISIQALMLLLQISHRRNTESKRFYRALYCKMVDFQNLPISKYGLCLHLIYKALKLDTCQNRIKAFVKRLLQISFNMPTSFVCGALYLISELFHEKPFLQTLLTHPEDNDEEQFFDVQPNLLQDENEPETPIQLQQNPQPIQESISKPQFVSSSGYDFHKRDPEFCKAETSCYWEMNLLSYHYHPSVAQFVKTILQKSRITYGGDPLQDFTLSRFLDRFVYKNPKKKESDHGGSIMQPKHLPLVLKGKSASSSESTSPSNKEQAMSGFVKNSKIHFAQTVNSKYFKSLREEDTPVDELFFRQYFLNRKLNQSSANKTDDNSDDLDSVHSDSSLDEETVDAALQEFDFSDQEEEDKDEGPSDFTEEQQEEDDQDEDEDEEDIYENMFEDSDDCEELADKGDQKLESDDDFSNSFEFAGDGKDDDSEEALEEKEPPKGKKRKSPKGSLFADADDFADIIEKSINENQSKQLAWENSGKNSSHVARKKSSASTQKRFKKTKK